MTVSSRWLLLGATFVLFSSGCTGLPLRTAESVRAPLPLVSFVFDDGNDTDDLVARPIFAARNAVAGSAVTTNRIGTPGYMTADQIRALEQAGWEIMSHTVSHPDLKKLPPTELDKEMARSKAELEGLGVKVANLVYPFNRNNAQVRASAGRHYRSARGGGSDFNRGVADRTLLTSFPLGHDLARLERLVDWAQVEGSWLILYLHEIDIQAKLAATTGAFRRGETLTFAPSGAVARFTVSHWFPLYGTHIYLVPLAGKPQPGDRVTGADSGATATLDHLMYDDPALLAGLLDYIRDRYPEMRIVTVDQGLDLLGLSKETH